MAIPISLSWMSPLPGILICVLSLTTLAQQPRSPHLPAPPPMKFVSRSERSELAAARDPKSRIRATIDLADGRLTRCEELTAASKFAEASEELGGYLGLMDDVRVFVGNMNHDKGSTRDLYRHLEIALRAHIPRLAVMRRSTPVAYAGNLKSAEEYVRDARSEALDSFYGHSVLREDVGGQKKIPERKESPEGTKHP